MNKENSQEDSLTPEQRARISLRFRAAKALLARKKPRFSSPLSVPLKTTTKLGSSCSTWVPKTERVPLKELQKPLESLSASRVSNQSDSRYVEVSSPMRSFADRLLDSSTSESNGCSRDGSLSTPINAQVQRSKSFSINHCSPVSSVLDEEFDSSIFEEIDLLLDGTHGSSAKQSEREVDTRQDHMPKTEPDDGNHSNTRTFFHTEIDNLHDVQGDVSSPLIGKVNITLSKECSGMPESYSKYLESLNEDQLDAASTDASTPLMVVAGPGSGKTSTMVGRILMLLNQGIGPSHILAMTFTTAAASEMRDRVGVVAGKEVGKALTISTFHSFSLQLCRAHADKLGRTSEFLIYGHGQQRRAVIEAVRLTESNSGIQSLDNCEKNISADDIKIQDFKEKSQKWQKFVTKAKASGKMPEECRQMGDQFGATVLSNYNDILRSCNALDYYDLISCSAKLLTDYPEVLEECQASWKAIIVDEFQDTSSMQYDLLRLLVSHGHITIVGDDDQSIFSFNGADISGFDSFRKDFPCHKEVRLKKNYRSTRCIVDAAASLIRHNVKRSQLKQAFTDNSSGSKVIKAILAMVKTALPGCDDNPFRQAFKTLLLYEKEEKKKKYLLEQRAVISVDGGKLLNEDNDLRSVLQYLLDDVNDFLSSQSVPRKTVLDDIVKNKGCIHVLQAFVDYISEREKENFRSRRQDNLDSVTLTTIHQSKGLEWDIVFIVKANDSEIPLLHEHNGVATERGNSLEEERRLLYVAMTRARKKLFMLYVTMDSNWQVLHPSRFFQEIPTHLLEVQADLNLSVHKELSVKIKSEAMEPWEAVIGNDSPSCKIDKASEDSRNIEASEDLINIEALSGNSFLKKFNVEDRALVSRIFHQWAKKKAFQDPKRLLDKVNFVINERLNIKKGNNKDILVALKLFLKCEEAFQFADYVIKWELIPSEKRLHLTRERQFFFSFTAIVYFCFRLSTERNRGLPAPLASLALDLLCHLVWISESQ
uniref:DNA 3'-5' helicase n=1 Tax=Chenopodium quinoa TaxID=63459 RepID=A0A803N937_CHEQI